MIGAISALAILLIAYWYYKTADEQNLPILPWVAGGVTAFFIFICYLHNVRLRRQRVADLLRYSDRRAATPCRP